MRLVTAGEMGAMDRKAIEDYGIPGMILMENAGLRVVEVISGLLNDLNGKKVVVVAGKGNNGGDGFVVARHLHNRGSEVQVFLAAEQEQIKGDAQINLNIWQRMGQKVYSLTKNNNLNLLRLALMNADLVVDALYGTGFKGAIREHMVPVIEAVNGCGKAVVAVDIPSGLEADTGRVYGPCIYAAHTITFALPKLGLVLPDAREFVGQLHIVDISIPSAVTAGAESQRFYITDRLVRDWWPRRRGGAHKGNFGRVLVIAGSRGMSGAAVLAAQAAARSGAGLVTLGVPAGIHDIAEAKLTEVMTFPLPENERGTFSCSALDEIQKRARSSDILVLGPGLGANNDTAALVKELLLKINTPCVLDADGLNVMVGKTELFKLVKAPLVLTPHPGEMSRLTGNNTRQIQDARLETAAGKAADWQCILVLKGAGTVVAGPDGTLFINGTGNPGMASGGTGDVLAGLIGGLIAQGMTPLHAAAAGAYLHGLAGDAAATERGMAGLLASDLLEQLPDVLKKFEL
ncbi:NAD(P)H-hydrate dehydratase [Desulfoscipio geothermicus]|uniref:Bifunctional NAD(P)H-hydrate repair enzyme n=1 Tax=Desulfoscipio geothermicus DSM 3669 TaxID=1121426 RepID=A0A1I6DXB8_9FIRM|nr:NAD(P)H-hydrate dehydratase [Desulfoscipio geothermicus]SFR09982.1 NAD(P)H-hydrate epimerase [Desulfoscipio geothermicus DSM 3669]